MRVDAMDTEFELVTVLNQPAIFTDFRIDPKTVPSGLYMYEIRHGDVDWDNPYQLGEWIKVNYYGAIITNRPIELEHSETINNAYRDIDPENDWNFEDGPYTVQQFMREYPIEKVRSRGVER